MEGEDLPELSLVYPLPGFPGLTRFVLVRLDDDEPDAPGEAEAADEPGEAEAADESDAAGGPAHEDPTPPDVPAGEPAGSPTTDPEALLFELRSLERADVRFLVGVPTAFFPDYTVELDEQACADLDLSTPDDALVLVVLSVGADATETTANLLAPLVINARTRAAAQVILTGSDWPVRAAVG